MLWTSQIYNSILDVGMVSTVHLSQLEANWWWSNIMCAFQEEEEKNIHEQKSFHYVHVPVYFIVVCCKDEMAVLGNKGG